jgi:hypothetical protein
MRIKQIYLCEANKKTKQKYIHPPDRVKEKKLNTTLEVLRLKILLESTEWR